MACFIFGAGDFYGLHTQPRKEDFIIAADGGWRRCEQSGVTPICSLATSTRWTLSPSFPTFTVSPWKRTIPT